MRIYCGLSLITRSSRLPRRLSISHWSWRAGELGVRKLAKFLASNPSIGTWDIILQAMCTATATNWFRFRSWCWFRLIWKWHKIGDSGVHLHKSILKYSPFPWPLVIELLLGLLYICSREFLLMHINLMWREIIFCSGGSYEIRVCFCSYFVG